MGSMGTTSAQSVKVVKSAEKHKVLGKGLNPQSNPQKAAPIKGDKGTPVNTPKH